MAASISTQKRDPVQELSIQRLNLEKIAKNPKLDLTSPFDQLIQTIINLYNQKKDVIKNKIQYEPKKTWQRGNYQIKTYEHRYKGKTALSQNVQDEPEDTQGSYFILFFYTQKIPCIFALTSDKAFWVVRPYIDYIFPTKVAEKVGDPEKIISITRRHLLGGPTKETILNQHKFELYKTSSLY